MKKKYQIIYADPPWSYTDKCHAGERGADYKYKTMDVIDIGRLPVGEIADPNSCALFLWSTMPFLPVAIEVMSAWGFTYKTVAFTWVKTNKKSGTPFMGMGNWTRANAELCLLGIKGRPKRISASVRQLVMSPVEAHSKKPDEVRSRIIDLLGDVPRLELFARQRSPGWDVFGNEVSGSIKL